MFDVTDAGRIAPAVAPVTASTESTGLTAFISNAGIGVFGPLEVAPLDSIRWHFEASVAGQIGVTQAFLQLLCRDPFVVIGAIGGRTCMPFGEPLGAFKAAIASMAEALWQELTSGT